MRLRWVFSLDHITPGGSNPLCLSDMEFKKQLRKINNIGITSPPKDPDVTVRYTNGKVELLLYRNTKVSSRAFS